MGKVVVVANGVIEDRNWLRPYLEQATAVIVADGGGHHLAALRIQPEVVVGDMDSLEADIWQRWQEDGTILVTYPEEKDETDLELALIYSVQNYADEIEIVGALGGRLDQMLGNISLLAHPALVGRQVTLVEPNQRAWLVRGRTVVDGNLGEKVSLIPLGGDVEIVRTEGLKWSLEKEVLHFGPARGISNVMTAETAVIEIRSGTLLCVHLTGEL